jgi:hypothetical protein
MLYFGRGLFATQMLSITDPLTGGPVIETMCFFLMCDIPLYVQ